MQQAWLTLLLARDSKAILVEAKAVIDKAHARIVDDIGDPEDWAADPDDEESERDPDDLLKLQLAAVEVETNMREALRVEALALSALWALAGSAAPAGFDVDAQALRAEAIAGGRRDLADYVEIAVAQRPEAKMAEAGVEARRAQARLARAEFLPDFGIALSFGVAVGNAADPEMSQLYYQDGFNYSRFTAALAMRWRWDTGAIFGLRRARAELRSAEYQRDAARLLLSRDVTEAYEDLVQTEARMATAQRASELSWKLVLSQEIKDSVGGGNAGELLRALEKWYRKRFEQAEAIHAHNEALARLARAVGRPLAAPGPRPGPSGAQK